MKLPLLEHAGLYLTRDFLCLNPPAAVQPVQLEVGGEGAEPDWERIGRDWVRPRNAAAHARLSAMLRRTLG